MSRHEPADADEMDALKDEGFRCDDVILRRTQAEVDYRRLIEARHALANRATAARLLADEMFQQVKELDRQIAEAKEVMSHE